MAHARLENSTYQTLERLQAIREYRDALAEVEKARGADSNAPLSTGDGTPEHRPAPAPLAEVITRVERCVFGDHPDIRRLLDVARKAQGCFDGDGTFGALMEACK